MTQPPPAAILLFGAPGSGKGTQGAVLGGLPGFFHLSSGEIFRSLDPSSADGQVVAECTSGGNLVPDDFTVSLWRKQLADWINDGSFDPDCQILLLDGIPRNSAQCGMIDGDVDVQLVLHLGGDDYEPLVERILERGRKQGRSDDSDEDVVRYRFEVYQSESAPVLEFYPNELLAHVDPIGLPSEVLDRVLQLVLPVQRRFLDRSN
jgi:adenylate kinase